MSLCFRAAASLSLALCVTSNCAADERPLRFNRDVRSILTDKCFACHGPDAKKVEGDLRLDLREGAIDSEAIVPGDAEASELVRRIFSDDHDEVMPPRESNKVLSRDEREVLRRWIQDGAEYEAHWAYAPMRRDADIRAGAIDYFIDRRLGEERIAPMGPADRITLIRRLSFDLTGLPPTHDEVDAFLNDPSDHGYRSLVDRLLRSKRFGERMAIYWLDLVRYADTVGYHGDQNVSHSPYRDYVINAFNTNMPYDRFVREQIAGDLLLDATIDQRVASGYNRLNQTTEEGGSQAKEYLAIYFADRVRSVSQVFMGATMGCAQCHDHKYDPYTMRDFYSLGAFFADLDERGVYSARGRPPTIGVPTADETQRLKQAEVRIAELESKVQPLRQELLAGLAEWESKTREEIDGNASVDTAWIDDEQDTEGDSSGDWDFVDSAEGPVYSKDKSRRQKSEGLVQHNFDDAAEKVLVQQGTRFYAWVHLDSKNPPSALMLQLNDGTWNHRAVWGSDEIIYGRRTENWEGYQRLGPLPKTNTWVRLEVDPSQLGLTAESTVKGMAFTQFGGLAHWDQSGYTTARIPSNVASVLSILAGDRSEDQEKAVTDYYIGLRKPMILLKEQIADAQAGRGKINDAITTMVVSQSVEPRTIRILPRGNWMDDSGTIVEPAIPEFMGDLNTDGVRLTRLDLAQWLCQSENVLTSRTMVNRLWSLMFGRGICSSVDDFGGQGTFPSHLDLLDWLAMEFVESGWDIKHILRTIVLSDAYRRSSKPTDALRQIDPYNNLIARQGRFRIAAEMVRDGALSVSGLLVERIGGVSAKPYQPSGYYAQLNFPRREYAASTDENQYRRGVYTHWQRTFLHPMLKAFDAPSREECTARRSVSNTPLQALALLNDPTFVEAARAFAARMMRADCATRNDRIAWGYRQAVSRDPPPQVAHELHHVLDLHLKHFRGNADDAKQLISQGNSPVSDDLDPAELAAWTGVARVILNLHETISRY